MMMNMEWSSWDFFLIKLYIQSNSSLQSTFQQFIFNNLDLKLLKYHMEKKRFVYRMERSLKKLRDRKDILLLLLLNEFFTA